MSHIPRLTLIGMYEYDNTIFNRLTLPEGIDRNVFIDTLLLKYGECPVIYPSVAFVKNAISIWSSKWFDAIRRMYEVLADGYNPLYNYDRYEQYTDTEVKTGETESSGTASQTTSGTDGSTTEQVVTNALQDQRTDNTTHTYNVTESEETTTEGSETVTHGKVLTTEDTISAMNESTYQPDKKQTAAESGTTLTDTEGTGETAHTKTGTETDTGTVTTTNTGTVTTRGTGSGTHSGTVTSTDGRTGSSEDNRTLEHTAHLYGNIGVTTSQQMLIEELKLRGTYNLYDILADLFKEEFCLYIY